MKLHFFDSKEFECKCGCGLNNLSPLLGEMIDDARHLAGMPFIVNSACRCEKHNYDVGGVKNSSHLKGLAIDIKCDNMVARYKIVGALISVGFKRILIYKSFIHCDIDLKKLYPIIEIMER